MENSIRILIKTDSKLKPQLNVLANAIMFSTLLLLIAWRVPIILDVVEVKSDGASASNFNWPWQSQVELSILMCFFHFNRNSCCASVNNLKVCVYVIFFKSTRFLLRFSKAHFLLIAFQLALPILCSIIQPMENWMKYKWSNELASHASSSTLSVFRYSSCKAKAITGALLLLKERRNKSFFSSQTAKSEPNHFCTPAWKKTPHKNITIKPLAIKKNLTAAAAMLIAVLWTLLYCSWAVGHHHHLNRLGTCSDAHFFNQYFYEEIFTGSLWQVRSIWH